jgi:AcrR family transcriptional regulator
MKRQKVDSRIERTQRRLRDALISLMAEHGYEKVTVQDILDRAEVGRATFYQHFRSKEDLLRSGIDQLRAGLIGEWKVAAEQGGRGAERLGFTLPLFQHFDSHRHLYKALVGREGAVVVEHMLRRMLTAFVREELAPRRPGAHAVGPTELAVQYVVGALWSVVTWWMGSKAPLSAIEVNNLFRQLTLPALDAALAARSTRTEVRS